MKPCKHLDHNPAHYPSCDLIELTGFSCPILFFQRRDYLPGGPLYYEGAPVKVQFCGLGKGRIRGVFQCYNEEEMSCYEPVVEADKAEAAERLGKGGVENE